MVAEEGRIHLTVAPAEAGMRLDRYLAEHLPGVSRSRLQHSIAEGVVLLNQAPVRAAYRVEPGDEIDLILPAPTLPEATVAAEEIPLRVLYEDPAMAGLDKPAGLVVHPAHGHAGGTLVNALLARYPELRRWPVEEGYPGLVHRLDRDTSGVLVVARTPAARDALRAEFKASTVRKVYLALVVGRPKPDYARIEAPIGRDPRERKRMAILTEGGRPAVSEYRVLEALGDYTLLEVRPATGRTHQIRVHLAAIGYPVAGDRVYGHRRERLALPRMFLHAAQLSLRHPMTGQAMTFSAPLPPDLEEVLSHLRK